MCLALNEIVQDPHPLDVSILCKVLIWLFVESLLLKPHLPSRPELQCIISHPFRTDVSSFPNLPGKHFKGQGRDDHGKPLMTLNLNPPINRYRMIPIPTSTPTSTLTTKQPQKREETETEWYNNISPIETNVEYKNRTWIDWNDEFYDSDIPFKNQDSVDLFHAKPLRLQASISATVGVCHPHIVAIYSSVGPNLIENC